MTARPPEPLIVDWLAHIARAYPDQPALIDLATARRFTYAQMFERVCRLARGLNAHGVGRGDRVMALARNSTDIYDMMFACWRVGAAFMPVNWRLAPPEVAEIVADGEPRLILADEEFAPNLPEGNPPRVIRRPGDAASDYEQLIARSDAAREFCPQSLDDMNMLLYTSGTTGRPKGVIGTWRMTTAMLLQSAITARLGPGCVTLTAAPLFHTAGLNSYATPTLHAGGAIAVLGQWQPELCLDLLADTELAVTHTLGVPTQFIAMARHPKFQTITFPSLRIAAIGGAPPTEELMRTWAAKGCALAPGYGMTEVFGGASLAPEEALRKPGAVGRAAPMAEIRIADETGAELPAGGVGEIQFKSPGVTPGYWRQPEATRAAFIEGWFRTGDMGYKDADGVLYLVDRKKDMFISGGENVYPAEVENVIASFPEVSQVAVIGVPDPTWGEVGKAVIVPRAGAVVDPGEILARCRGKIAPYKIPKSVAIAAELPLSAQNKVLKTELRKRYG
jgi:fatty-acyl-CoA synthase